MSEKSVDTKESIIEAATFLFNVKGFQGTTIRDIAKRAGVNPANISYYFSGKQGLLEVCFINFFEPYLLCWEKALTKLETVPAKECLKEALKNILNYQSENHLLTRLVWREVTIDSQVSREVISSYLMKERYYLKTLLAAVLQKNLAVYPTSMIIIQLKGMLTFPYLNSQYTGEVWAVFPKEAYFAEKYYTMIIEWLDVVIGLKQKKFTTTHLQPIRESV